MNRRNIALGIVAHVDAGKTTLSEALLYETGKIRTLGRVDHQDAFLDTDTQERERGITIFSKQAQLESDGVRITLLDTPGHVDFSAEMERTLMVLDYAILVISGTDGVQGHTKTLWRLLSHYQIPTYIFVNKMDLCGADEEDVARQKQKVLAQLKNQLSDGCVAFTELTDRCYEEIAMCSDTLLDSYMENGVLTTTEISEAIRKRQVFPCFFGSALKLAGVKELLEGIRTYGSCVPTGTDIRQSGNDEDKLQEPDEQAGNDTKQSARDADFGALVYKIGRDPKGARLTHIKVTQGCLNVKDKVSYSGREGLLEEKIDQIRIYSGDKYEMTESVETGDICAVTGLTETYPGMGIGANESAEMPILEPVLNYRVIVPQGVNPVELMRSLKQLEEEDPMLHILWNEQLQEIHAQLMGQVQMEVLGREILERFDVRITFGPGNIVYKETIAKPVEGVGHYEPLRHYAEAHLWMEPGEPGSGISVHMDCSEDVLDLNWQRLIATHILEREHPGVLTGSAITDMRITIVTGRAHLKHTEGGDFRQATYRAIRQGLKSTESVLLEPMYAFSLEVPAEQIGRAMTDIRNRFGKHENPQYLTRDDGDVAILTGTAPVATMQDYVSEVHAYTKGSGRLTLELKGYDVCHNSAEVVEAMGYDSETDTANPTGSVFCAHGAGFVVPWDEVPQYMHLEYVRQGRTGGGAVGMEKADGLSYDLEAQAEELRQLAQRREEEKLQQSASSSSWEMDKELQQIYAREFGMNKDDMAEYERRKWAKKSQGSSGKTDNHVKLDKKGNPIYPKNNTLPEFLIIDGYNIIFALADLKELSQINMDSAKDKLKDMLVNLQGYKGCRMMLVFDGYRVKGNPGSATKYFDLEVIHTKQDETADMYIERTVHLNADKYRITVATNDGLEQLTVLSQGALRMTAAELEQVMLGQTMRL